MEKRITQMRRWLLPAVLILFILEIATLPFVLGLTYSGRSESPDRVLHYDSGELLWDSAAHIRDDGTAELPLFEMEYDNSVFSRSRDKVLAPGTEGDCLLRLENGGSRAIRYTAVVYELRSDERLPVQVQLEDGGFEDTADYTLTLPEGAELLRAVTGTVEAEQRQDFDIRWLWSFEEDAARDGSDTDLGNESAAGEAAELSIGFYIAVEDQGEVFTPEVDKTGDTSLVELYVILLCVSGGLLLWLLAERKKEKEGRDA